MIFVFPVILQNNFVILSEGKCRLYIGLGDKEKALSELERAYDDHSVIITFLPTDPRFDGLRSDPRFKYLLRRAGLPAS